MIGGEAVGNDLVSVGVVHCFPQGLRAFVCRFETQVIASDADRASRRRRGIVPHAGIAVHVPVLHHGDRRFIGLSQLDKLPVAVKISEIVSAADEIEQIGRSGGISAPAQADPYAADGVLKRRAVGQSDGYERKKRRQYQQHGGGFFNSRFYHIKTPLTSNIHKWYYRTIVLLFDYSIIIAKPEPVFKSNLYDDHCLKE